MRQTTGMGNGMEAYSKACFTLCRTSAEQDHCHRRTHVLTLADVSYEAMSRCTARRTSRDHGPAPADASQCGALINARQQALLKRGMERVAQSPPKNFP